MKRFIPLALLMLTACGGSRPAPELYTLQATPPAVEACRAGSTIKIVEPVAGAGLDSPRIAVMERGGKQTFYRGVRWNAATTRMLQLYLADTFEQSGMFATVLTDDSTSRARYLLETQLRDFHIDQSQGVPVVRIRLSANLVDAASRRPLLSVPLAAERGVSGQNMQGIVQVFNEEMAALSTDLLARLRGRIGCR